MSPVTAETFLLDQFREFYREVVRLKRGVALDTWVYEGEEEGEPAASERSPTAVWQRLLTLLERQALVARRRGGDFGEGFYRDAQYLMAALADEVFLHLDWRGSESWSSNLLESKLFQTHHAGEAVFARLDKVLAGRDPVHVDLAKVYLLMLGLGFQGKFRGTHDGAYRIAEYRQEILEFVSEREPQFRDGVRQLFPEAYASTLEQGSGERLPHLRRWIWTAAAVAAVWLLVSSWLWWDLTRDLRPVIERILNGT